MPCLVHAVRHTVCSENLPLILGLPKVENQTLAWMSTVSRRLIGLLVHLGCMVLGRWQAFLRIHVLDIHRGRRVRT